MIINFDAYDIADCMTDEDVIDILRALVIKNEYRVEKVSFSFIKSQLRDDEICFLKELIAAETQDLKKDITPRNYGGTKPNILACSELHRRITALEQDVAEMAKVIINIAKLLPGYSIDETVNKG